jgi:hypothetical protein
VTFERRDKTTTITERPWTLSHTVDTRETHSFSKEEVIAALGVEVPEGSNVFMYTEETTPPKLLLLITDRKVIS